MLHWDISIQHITCRWFSKALTALPDAERNCVLTDMTATRKIFQNHRLSSVRISTTHTCTHQAPFSIKSTETCRLSREIKSRHQHGMSLQINCKTIHHAKTPYPAKLSHFSHYASPIRNNRYTHNERYYRYWTMLTYHNYHLSSRYRMRTQRC